MFAVSQSGHGARTRNVLDIGSLRSFVRWGRTVSQTVDAKQPGGPEAPPRLLLTKLHPPPQREQTVARDRLV
jgi:hypothetical protein